MVRQEAKRSTAGAGGDAEAIDTEPVSAVRLTDAHSGLLRAQEQEELRLTALQNTATGTAARSVTMPCQVRMRENLYASRSLASSKGLHCIQQMCRNAAGGRKSEGASQSAKRKQMDDGLNLARVGLGDDVGRAGLGDMVSIITQLYMHACM